jgi:hypothetical protein
LLNINSAVWGTSILDTPDLWRSLPTQSIATDVMRTIGFMTLSRANNDWKVSISGKAFTQAYLAQPNTVTIGPGGREVCHSGFDSTGYQLYQSVNTSGHTVCTGLNFSTFRSDGWDIPHLAAYAYDATLAMGYAVVNYSAAVTGHSLGEKSFYIPDDLDGVQLTNYMLNNLSFDGATGPVKFSSGRNHIFNYGLGDRLVGQRFAVVNFQYDNITEAGFFMPRVATWSTDDGYELCGDDESFSSVEITGGCHDILWGTPGNAIPVDRDSPIHQAMPPTLQSLLIALALIQIVAALFFAFTLIYFKKKRLLRASQPVMMWFVLLAGIYSAVRIYLASTPIESSTCVAKFWMGHMAFTGIIALMLKTLRVHLLVNSSGFRRLKITTVQVVMWTAIVIAVMMLYMAVVTAISTPRAFELVTIAVTGQYTYSPYCATANASFDYVLYIYEVLILFSAAKLAFDTKDVPDAINESQIVALGKLAYISTSVSPCKSSQSAVLCHSFLIVLNPSILFLIRYVSQYGDYCIYQQRSSSLRSSVSWDFRLSLPWVWPHTSRSSCWVFVSSWPAHLVC